MGQVTFTGIERYNQLVYGFKTPDNIIAVVDQNDTLTIFTKDVDYSQLKQSQANLKIAVDALEWYSSPYNCTPDRDAIYCVNVNAKAWEALQEIKENNND